MSDEATKTEQAEAGKTQHFDADMTIGAAMAVHPRVREVFAAFHLGGCSHCAISQFETVGQVCAGYGVDVDMLIEALEDLTAQEA